MRNAVTLAGLVTTLIWLSIFRERAEVFRDQPVLTGQLVRLERLTLAVLGTNSPHWRSPRFNGSLAPARHSTGPRSGRGTPPGESTMTGRTGLSSGPRTARFWVMQF